MNYEQALEFLVGLTKFGFNFGLGRIIYLMELLGNPHRKLKVIHVGGTNGKGSVAMMVARVLEEAGYRVGLFTSPHLHSYTERYLINCTPISEERFAQLIDQIRPCLEQMVREGQEHPTEFEVCTALAFLYFYQEQVDYLVLEVGLGGAIDSTNVVNPLVSVITNVAMDHMDYLGHTIREIATVKAGIIKQNGYVVTAASHPDALQVIEERCREMGATLYRVGQEIRFTLTEANPEGTRFDLDSCRGKLSGLWVPLAGQYQAINGATAVAVLEILRRKMGVRIGDEDIRHGLAKGYWPARLELIHRKPDVLVDVTHNYDGARNLRKALEEIYHYRRLILVMGMLGDKEREKVIAELVPLASRVVITKPLSPRAGDWQELANQARRYLEQVKVVEEIPAAVAEALTQAEPEDLVCVTGSFYMVADARRYLVGRFGGRAKAAAVKFK